jgi:hypothetical protein
MVQRKLPIIMGDTEGNPRMFGIVGTKIKGRMFFLSTFMQIWYKLL